MCLLYDLRCAAGMIADRDSQLKRMTRALEARERALAEAQAALAEAQRAPPPPPAPPTPAAASGPSHFAADDPGTHLSQIPTMSVHAAWNGSAGQILSDVSMAMSAC